MKEIKNLPENVIKKEGEKYASVNSVITTSEQEYIDHAKKYAHNDLYPTATVEVLKIENEKALVRDNTGDFWVPKEKLDL